MVGLLLNSFDAKVAAELSSLSGLLRFHKPVTRGSRDELFSGSINKRRWACFAASSFKEDLPSSCLGLIREFDFLLGFRFAQEEAKPGRLLNALL